MILGTQTDALIKNLHLLMRSPFMIDGQMRKLANTKQCLVPTSASMGQDMPLLKRESRGESVKRLQRLLNGAGAVPALPTTGYFGEMTWMAVMNFQSRHQIQPVDGVVGAKTWAAIERIGGKPVVVPVGSFPSAVVYSKLAQEIPAQVIGEMPAVVEKFEINNSLRLAHFLAQCAHESVGFKATTENMNYSAEGLLKVFGKYFNGDQADEYKRKPESIGSRVYANRMGNGDEQSGEGYKYRGRGYIQLTGKNNYTAFGLAVGDNVLNNPDLVAEKYPLTSAAWWWDNNSMNSIADEGATNADVKAVTKKVNGGTNGLDDRIKWFKKFYKILA